MGENIRSNLDVINVRGLPIGNSNFKDMMEHNDLFVDKSMIIAKLLKDRPKVHLFTRPRRFGKTTTLMMLKEFFDIRKKEENKNLFNNLAISKTEYMENYQGEHPVIFISFKDIKYRTAKESFSLVKGAIRMMYDNHKYLLKSLDEKEKKKFEKILNEENCGDYEKSILNLSKYLYDYWGKKVIILIDEYDTPLITSYVYDYYEEVVSFYRVMYGLAFKDNMYLEKAVITGINRIAKEGMFSGLNNLKVNTIFSKEYEKYFGFTEEEIKELLKEYELENELENVKKWYDGYKFNGVSIYNTWSIINYLYHREFGIYWINTGDNGEITKFLGDITKKLKE